MSLFIDLDHFESVGLGVALVLSHENTYENLIDGYLIFTLRPRPFWLRQLRIFGFFKRNFRCCRNGLYDERARTMCHDLDRSDRSFTNVLLGHERLHLQCSGTMYHDHDGSDRSVTHVLPNRLWTNGIRTDWIRTNRLWTTVLRNLLLQWPSWSV